MAITGVSNYNSVYENTYAASGKEAAKKEETKEISAAKKSTESAKKSNNEEYIKNLQKKLTYMKLQIGYGINTNNDGKLNVLAVNPKLLEKMQNDTKAAKEYTRRLKDIEAATKWVDSFEKSMGYTAVVRHGYVDGNGNFSNFAVVVRKDELNEKFRKEAQENAEKRIEKSRENVRKNAGQLAEKLEKKEDGGRTEKAEKLLADKLENAEDGKILLDNEDMQKVIEVAREQEKRPVAKHQGNNANAAGANLDFKI